MGRLKTNEEYMSEVYDKNINIEVIGVYKNATTPIAHKCKICGYGSNGEWNPIPSNVLRGRGCPVCSNPPKIIGPAPEYRNSIWSSKYKQLAEYYGITEEQMKTMMPNSSRTLEVLCPSCGNITHTNPNILFKNDFSCEKCSDGISYPEKFMKSFLDQLHICYEKQYSPDWANKKRYDFYLLDYNCIVEVHGVQHYTHSFNGKALKEEQENDKYKKRLAIQNGIKNYITIDCRKSNVDWIKSHIVMSNILTLLSVTEQDIDWDQCNIEALKSHVKVASNYWNEGKSSYEIAKIMKVSPYAIYTWLKRANDAKMCIYNKNEALLRHGHPYHLNWQTIVQCDKNLNVIKVWYYTKQIHDCLNINMSNIISCCMGRIKTSGGFIWKYLYDKTTKNGTVIPGAISLGLITEEEASSKLTKQNDLNN